MARESCQNYGNRSTAFYTQATALGIPLNWVCPHNRVNTSALLGKYLEIVYILKLRYIYLRIKYIHVPQNWVYPENWVYIPHI